MAIAEKSIISTDEIEMRFVPHCAEDYDFNNRYRLKYYIRLKNKTDHLIYIDRANCFRKKNTDAVTSYYDTKQVNISQRVSGGLGIGANLNSSISILGGAGSSTTQSTLYSQQRFISIPPHSEVNLTEYVFDAIRKHKTVFTKNYTTIYDIESWEFPINKEQYKLKHDGVIEFDETNTPYRCEYFITYSTNPNFSDYSILNCHMYAKYLVGRDYNNWSEVFSFLRIQKYISNFEGSETEPEILIGQPTKVR